MTRQETKKETASLRLLIGLRLKTRAQVGSGTLPLDVHLDEDAIGSFVEGRLGEAESPSLIAHLVACAFCRRTTAELIRLESHIDVEDESISEDQNPGRLRVFLEHMAARTIAPAEEDAVFAYQNPAEDSDERAPQTTEAARAEPVQEESAPE
ncbi:MAG: hypothetical protein ACREA9_18435, partial [Pyrinomonadaceae bacterium]